MTQLKHGENSIFLKHTVSFRESITTGAIHLISRELHQTSIRMSDLRRRQDYEKLQCHSVTQGDLELILQPRMASTPSSPPASAFGLLELQACATPPFLVFQTVVWNQSEQRPMEDDPPERSSPLKCNEYLKLMNVYACSIYSFLASVGT